MIDYPGAPSVIPTRTSMRTADHRRRSLPANSANTPARRSANHVSVKPASPEVICSLISTLSAISPPVDREFEYLPTASFSQSTPSSPLPYQAQFPQLIRSTGHVDKPDLASPTTVGFGMEYDAYGATTNLVERTRLHPNHATSHTIIHRSTKRIPSSDTIHSFLSRSDAGRGYEFEEISSMGSLSVKPGPYFSATSIESPESSSQKSTKSFESLNIRSSITKLIEENKRSSQKDVVAFTKVDNNFESCVAEAEVEFKAESNGLRSPTLSASSDYGKPIIKGSSLEGLQAISRSSSTHKRVSKATLGESNTSPCITDFPRAIPARESSLRHSYGGSPSHRKRKSYRLDPAGTQETRKFSFEYGRDFHMQATPKTVDSAVADDVSRRIKELKDQKRLRELRDCPLTIATSDLMITTESSRNSRSPSPLPAINKLSNEYSEDIQRSRNSHVGEESKLESSSFSAPSPSIVQRINRNSSLRVGLAASKTIAIKQSQLKGSSEHERVDPVPPKRSNSRLLRRLSRPSSPTNAEKHKRTFSNPLIDERPKSTDYVDEAVNDYISSARLSQKIKNPQTGRIISFSEVGDPDGSAVFCCVGMGLTRYITAFYDDLASTLKLRLITPDRPGVGASEAHEDGLDTPLGWPGDDISSL